jgi:hypothetical protein
MRPALADGMLHAAAEAVAGQVDVSIPGSLAIIRAVFTDDRPPRPASWPSSSSPSAVARTPWSTSRCSRGPRSPRPASRR